MSKRTEGLQRLLGKVLVGALPDSLKNAIDDALAKGIPRAAILNRARAYEGRAPMTFEAIRTYLGKKS